MQTLTLIFPFPDLSPYYTRASDRYIAHLIGHESHGSILSVLKKRGWATSLYAYREHGAKNFDFFKVAISLSDEGLKNWMDAVVLVFQHVKLLQMEGAQEWIYHEVNNG
jgi:insulysin